MKSTNSPLNLLVVVFAFVYGFRCTSSAPSETSLWQVRDLPAEGNPKAARIHQEDVSKHSEMLLSDMKTAPTFDMGDDMVFRLELEEPSNDNKAMNAARKAIGETPSVMDAAKRKLAALLKNDAELNVPWDNDAWLIRFLRLKNYDVPKTYKLIRSYYHFKAKNGAIFNNLVPSQEKDVAEQGVYNMLPNRSPTGSRITVVQTKKWNPKKYPLLKLCRLGAVISEFGAYEPSTQLAGIEIVLDMSGLTWQHIRQFNPHIAKTMVQWFLSGLPVKFEGIHVVNQPRIFWSLFNMFRPFLTEEIRSKLHFHGKNMNSLHKYIPAESLPDIYGGSFPEPELSSYEWETLLRASDEEFAKIASYGRRRT